MLHKEPSKRLGCLFGVKEILVHPWVGKINPKLIEEKGLTPPFLPDLESFNFDPNEPKGKTRETWEKLEQDSRTVKFTTFFNEQFYF